MKDLPVAVRFLPAGWAKIREWKRMLVDLGRFECLIMRIAAARGAFGKQLDFCSAS